LTIRVTTQVGQAATTIRIEGKLTRADLRDVQAACDSANVPLVLDLSGLKSADTDGIQALCSLSETRAKLEGASPYIRQLLFEIGRSRK
jgi:anti-anti-sigma regulatory factor